MSRDKDPAPSKTNIAKNSPETQDIIKKNANRSTHEIDTEQASEYRKVLRKFRASEETKDKLASFRH